MVRLLLPNSFLLHDCHVKTLLVDFRGDPVERMAGDNLHNFAKSRFVSVSGLGSLFGFTGQDTSEVLHTPHKVLVIVICHYFTVCLICRVPTLIPLIQVFVFDIFNLEIRPVPVQGSLTSCLLPLEERT